MEVTVNMRAEEFKEFMAWKKDRERYTKEMAAKSSEWEIMAKKVTWAIEEDPKRPGKVTRRSCWSWPMTTYHIIKRKPPAPGANNTAQVDRYKAARRPSWIVAL